MTTITPSLIVYGYLAAINCITFILFGADKIFARAGAWRVRERTLLILALLGGSPAALLAMKLFRHKTIKTSFQIMIALILVVQMALLALVFHNSSLFSPLLTTPANSLY